MVCYYSLCTEYKYGKSYSEYWMVYYYSLCTEYKYGKSYQVLRVPGRRQR